MGMAAAAVGAGSEALFGNPASLLHVQGLHVHLSVCHPFAMNDLVYQNASAAIPVCRGIVGIGFQSMGCTLYQERTWVIGAAGTVAGRFRCGAALRLLHLRIERYGEAASSCIDFGALVGIGAGLSLGVSCHNATRARLNDEQPVPRTLQIGLSKMLFNTLLVTIQVAKDDAFPIEIRAGAEFVNSPTRCESIAGSSGKNAVFFSAGQAAAIFMHSRASVLSISANNVICQTVNHCPSGMLCLASC